MNDISLHIMDIVQNSISAGATYISISVEKNGDLLSFTIADNGKGMTAAQVGKLSDPFFTTRTTRKVGMGIPLLKMSAEQSGGTLHIESEPGTGTIVRADFGYSHIDRPPLGDIANAFMLIASSNPRLHLALSVSSDGEEYGFDTDDAREILGENCLTDFSIVREIENMIRENVKSLGIY